jgi:hypothetical protein
MARLRLDSPDCAEGDRVLLIELVESAEADTWRSGRWHCLYDPNQDVYDCQPRPGLHIVMFEEPDQNGELSVGIVTIHVEPDIEDDDRQPF